MALSEPRRRKDLRLRVATELQLCLMQVTMTNLLSVLLLTSMSHTHTHAFPTLLNRINSLAVIPQPFYTAGELWRHARRSLIKPIFSYCRRDVCCCCWPASLRDVTWVWAHWNFRRHDPQEQKLKTSCLLKTCLLNSRCSRISFCVHWRSLWAASPRGRRAFKTAKCSELNYSR